MSRLLYWFIPPRHRWPVVRQRLIGFLFGGAFVTLYGYGFLGVDSVTPDTATLDTAKVIRLIKSHHVEPIHPEALREQFLSGGIAKVDRYAQFMTAEANQTMQKDLNAEYIGIGVAVDEVPTGFVVREVFAESGAAEAGLRRGDLLLRAGKLDFARRDVLQEVKLAALTGEAGTRVALAIRRDGQVFERQVTRKAVIYPSVRSDVFFYPNKREGKRVGYFVISEFKARTDAELARQLAAKVDRMDGLVLVLTGNPGGLVSSAKPIAELFLKPGTTLFWMVTRENSEGEAIKAADNKTETWQGVLTPAQLVRLETLPMIVMVNGGSASASELLSGALQDHGRARVFGTKTFGKGSMQSPFDLPNGEALSLTTARYLTPNRYTVEGAGIQPDFVPSRKIARGDFPDFENGTFPKDELNPNWLLQAAVKLFVADPVVAAHGTVRP